MSKPRDRNGSANPSCGFGGAALFGMLALAGPLSAKGVERVDHGMIVTPGTGERVRVLSYPDGALRITIGGELPLTPSTPQVVADPAGSPDIVDHGADAVLQTVGASAKVAKADGALTITDADGKVLLEEFRPARSISPVVLEGQQWFSTRIQFNRGTDEGLFGLGQHQNRQMNYNGEDIELAQHNMAIAVPYLVSTRGYGLLWDNASITRVGNPVPYEKLQLAWQASYFLGDKLAVRRNEPMIDYQYLADQTKWPEAAKAQTTAANTGQNTQGNAVQKQRVVWTGEFAPGVTGLHKFRLYSSSYVKVFADDKLVLERWRQNWNPWYHNFELSLVAGKTVSLRVEWEPNQGYITLEHADPRSYADRHSVEFASDAGKAIDFYLVPGKTMDEMVAGYRRLTGKAPMMPRWTYGFWQSRQRYETQDQLVGVVKQYREAKIPLDAIVQDWFYWPEDAWGSHAFDPARFSRSCRYGRCGPCDECKGNDIGLAQVLSRYRSREGACRERLSLPASARCCAERLGRSRLRQHLLRSLPRKSAGDLLPPTT